MVNALPDSPESYSYSQSSDDIKIADPDILIFNNDLLPIDTMADLIFENIGGQELINIARNDIVNGQDVAYRPIKNLTKLSQKYNSQTLVPLQNSSRSYFRNFAIKLEDHIPSQGSGPNGEIVYIDTTGDLILNVKGLAADERVEVQILKSGAVLDGTIYTEES